MKRPAIFDVFGRSPIRPLQAHMGKICMCVDVLTSFFNAALSGDWDGAQTHQRNIAQFENEADQIKQELRVHLPSNLFLPVPRSDLLEILTVQDKIADKARDIAGLILGRQLSFPAAMGEHLEDFLTCNIEAVRQANRVVSELDELLETGFVGAEVAVVEKMIHEIDAIESRSDQMQIALRRQLHQLESTLSPIDAIFMYEVIDLTGQLADGAKHVGNNLQLLLAR